jgi:Family of unknown function (DUF6074)
MSDVIPFPLVRRHQLIFSIARRALELDPIAGDGHVRRSIDLQATVMRRKGIAEHFIVRETRSLDSAIRAQMWNSVMLPREEG